MIDLTQAKATDILDLAGRFTKLERVTPHEYSGPCPKCGGRDRFHVNAERGWFCRRCTGEPGSGGHWGDAIDLVMWLDNLPFRSAVLRLTGKADMTPEELARITLQREQRETERKREEADATRRARQELNQRADWKEYNLHPDAVKLWARRGVAAEWVAYYGLGYCAERDSLTIPYHYPVEDAEGIITGFELIDLKHRMLANNTPGGKYRHHIPGLGNNLFLTNLFMPLDRLIGDVLIVEGEIKAIITWAALWRGETCLTPEITVIGVPGKNWKAEWVEYFRGAERVFINLDPDANSEGKLLAQAVGANARALLLPEKIDDLILAGALDWASLPRLLDHAWGGG